MKDNEIIKALECCGSFGGEGDCIKCPYGKMNSSECLTYLAKNALDLINCQKAEIERVSKEKLGLEHDLHIAKEELMCIIENQEAEIEQKDTEIDILIRKKATLKDELAEKQAEIEELQKYKHDYYVLQSITRKEFAERLKEKAISPRKSYDSEYEYVITEGFIDNLLEKMESERE